MQSNKHVLYLGDTSLSGAAAYLAGLMTAFGIQFDYLPSDKPVTTSLAPSRKLFILSDYPSKLMSDDVQRAILDQVHQGAGLLMIGGWESFHGHGGNWDSTPIGDALPVEIPSEDDRINCDQPALLVKATDHEILDELPWDLRPPTVGGFNRFIAKPQAAVLLNLQRFAVTRSENSFQFTPDDVHPMLVVGAHGSGRTTALATDLAPHWVGGFVDWGDERVTAQASGSWQIEVGNLYSQFIANLLAWTGKLHVEPVE